MRYSFCKKIFIITVLILNVQDFAQYNLYEIGEDNPVSQQGSVSFILHTSQSYENGYENRQSFSQKLLEIPGLATCTLVRDYLGIFISMQWDVTGVHNGYYLLFTELPGPENYHILFTWDAEKGLSDGYFNGIPFKLENPKYYESWQVVGSANQFNVPPGPNRVSEVNILSKYLSPEEVKIKLPEELKGKHSDILGQRSFPPAIDITGRKGKLLYISKMDNKESMSGWVLEGPAIFDFVDSSMIMRSQIANPPDGSTGHFNYWCPEDFPSNIIVEWEFKPLSDKGVCHLFLSATGKNGEDIFDPMLPERDGHFHQYINGAIDNYYFIYFSNLRKLRTSNLATTWFSKSSKQSVLTLGQIGVTPGEKEFHKICVIKDRAHFQMIVDGIVCLDYTDPGNERWGPVLGGGKIGFRQMAVTMAAYRNLNVWELE